MFELHMSFECDFGTVSAVAASEVAQFVLIENFPSSDGRVILFHILPYLISDDGGDVLGQADVFEFQSLSNCLEFGP